MTLAHRDDLFLVSMETTLLLGRSWKAPLYSTLKGAPPLHIKTTFPIELKRKRR
ncbi:UNVERIFIED_CONTAM: hypothetical protein K2H54_025426, partial [Gekko kuhli]